MIAINPKYSGSVFNQCEGGTSDHQPRFANFHYWEASVSIFHSEFQFLETTVLNLHVNPPLTKVYEPSKTSSVAFWIHLKHP